MSEPHKFHWRPGYNPTPQTPNEHLGNCRFQLENVEGWLLCHYDHCDGIYAARAKAECLVTAAQKLVESLNKKIEDVEKQPIEHLDAT